MAFSTATATPSSEDASRALEIETATSDVR
jgi:hypothetical protein